MASNSLYPGFIRILYTSNNGNNPHVQTLPVNPVAPAGTATLLTEKGGGTILWSTFVFAWVALIKPLFNTADSFDTAEMWTISSVGATPLLQDSISIAVAGTAGGGDVEWTQLRMSFKAADGKRAVVQLMETIAPVDEKTQAPLYGGNTNYQGILNYLVSSAAAIWSRSGAYISSGVNEVTKTNDKLRKKFLNP